MREFHTSLSATVPVCLAVDSKRHKCFILHCQGYHCIPMEGNFIFKTDSLYSGALSRNSQEETNSLELMDFSCSQTSIVPAHGYFDSGPCLINSCCGFISPFFLLDEYGF